MGKESSTGWLNCLSICHLLQWLSWRQISPISSPLFMGFWLSSSFQETLISHPLTVSHLCPLSFPLFCSLIFPVSPCRCFLDQIDLLYRSLNVTQLPQDLSIAVFNPIRVSQLPVPLTNTWGVGDTTKTKQTTKTKTTQGGKRFIASQVQRFLLVMSGPVALGLRQA